MSESQEFYTAPEHGWTCFHCGETFMKEASARRHFGADPSDKPGCIAKVEGGRELGLLVALRNAEEEIQRLRVWDEQQEHDASSYHGTVRDLERYFGKGVRSAHQAFLVLDSMEGRALAAEDRLRKVGLEP